MAREWGSKGRGLNGEGGEGLDYDNHHPMLHEGGSGLLGGAERCRLLAERAEHRGLSGGAYR